ncbi:FliH/SctL family protein [Cellulomonas timonensis]|uniref:FliH/SctL family protein n=1 Tax=Cellulomonas timonensis TaxID=1689271 RepID=UPI0008306668|nr:FliH/SctL family protein [Cellulomonas timonensis]
MSPDLRTSPFETAFVGQRRDESRDAALTAELDRARGAGHAVGFAAGRREAAEAAAVESARAAREREQAVAAQAAQHAAALAVLQRAAAAAAARTAPVLAELEQRLHAAALELAQAILGHELRDGEHSARAALARVRSQPQQVGGQTVRLHPRDLAALEAAVAPADVSGLTLVADAALAVGDAVSEHADGYLDARLTTALDRVRAVLDLPEQAGP